MPWSLFALPGNSIGAYHQLYLTSIWKSTNHGMNVQYDSCKNIKQVLKIVRQEDTEKLKVQLLLRVSLFLSY